MLYRQLYWPLIGLKKQKNQDILYELLSTPTGDMPPEIEELTAFIRRQGEIPPKPAKRGHVSSGRKRKKKKAAAKKKTTHYLSEEIFDGLDEAKDKIREIVPSDKKTGVSKSKIVNHALTMILQEFEVRGERSSLMQRILKKPQKPQTD